MLKTQTAKRRVSPRFLNASSKKSKGPNASKVAFIAIEDLFSIENCNIFGTIIIWSFPLDVPWLNDSVDF